MPRLLDIFSLVAFPQFGGLDAQHSDGPPYAKADPLLI